MDRRLFVKSILSLSVAAALPSAALSRDPFNLSGQIIKYDGVNRVVDVYSTDELPAPVDGCITFADNTTYNLMGQ